MFISWSRDKHLVCILILLMFVIDNCASGISSRTPCIHNRIYIMVFFIFYPCVNEATRKTTSRLWRTIFKRLSMGKPRYGFMQFSGLIPFVFLHWRLNFRALLVIITFITRSLISGANLKW